MDNRRFQLIACEGLLVCEEAVPVVNTQYCQTKLLALVECVGLGDALAQPGCKDATCELKLGTKLVFPTGDPEEVQDTASFPQPKLSLIADCFLEFTTRNVVCFDVPEKPDIDSEYGRALEVLNQIGVDECRNVFFATIPENERDFGFVDFVNTEVGVGERGRDQRFFQSLLEFLGVAKHDSSCCIVASFKVRHLLFST